MTRSAVMGAGGFIGGHLARALLERGDEVTCADIKPIAAWKQVHAGARNLGLYDLADIDAAEAAVGEAEVIYSLQANAGGMGYISTHKADCTLSVRADANMIKVARETGSRIFYSSSACVYPLSLQQTAGAPDLAEHMAYPPEPEEAYGWEKLFAERMYLAHAEDYGVPVRIGRYQSVYGTHAVWTGGREKAPTAICRKIATAKLTRQRTIGIWGDGTAIRTFTYVDDAVRGTLAVTACPYGQPLNIGSDEAISISDLVGIVEDIAGWRVHRQHVPGPVGVPGRRGCDTTLVRQHAGWKAEVSAREGLERTYAWVYDRVKAELG